MTEQQVIQPTGEQVSGETLGAEGISQVDGNQPGEMNLQGANDAGSMEELARLREENLRWQNDLNAMKSSFQSNAAKREQEYKAQMAQLQKQIDEQRLASFKDDKERNEYQKQIEAREVQELRQQLQNTQQMLAQQQQRQQYVNVFKSLGVNVDESQPDPVSVWNAGWKAMTEELQNLRRQVQGQPVAPQQPNQTQAPAVTPNSYQRPTARYTMLDVAKKYGLETKGDPIEEVFKAVERRQIPASELEKVTSYR